MSHFVIIGGGQAGSTLAGTLRSRGFDGRITLIGGESVPPYQRPPLSKGYLLGEMSKERLFLRPAEWYADNGIELRTGTRATGIDPAAREVELEAGERLPYTALALATGSHPRTLPAETGGTLEGVYTVRDLQDADSMAPEFEAGRRVLIIGGGYIGLEAAAVAAKRGLTVTLVEMSDRILRRVAAPETSDYFRALHRAHGVDIREGVGLAHLVGNDRVTGAALSDGTHLDIDFAIVGVGITPATILADTAGLSLDNGIATDGQCRTSDPHIWAAGDCASYPHAGARIRLESVGNAIDMAEIAARNMLGEGVDYVPKPWFWSDQYDCKLQIAGINSGYDRVVIRQSGTAGAQSNWYYAGDTLLAVDAMNDSRSYMIGKRLIEGGKSPDPAQLADPGADLKSLLSA